MELPATTAPVLPPSARPATAADVATLAALHRDALAELTGRRGGEALAAVARRAEPEVSFTGDLGTAGRVVLLGCLGTASVGLAVVELRPPAPAAVLELWVEPGARGVGVGHHLLTAVIEAARGAGCPGVDASALPGDRATKNFFEDHAMVARLITVHRGFGTP